LEWKEVTEDTLFRSFVIVRLQELNVGTGRSAETSGILFFFIPLQRPKKRLLRPGLSADRIKRTGS
jgi:hypothetical protein